MSKDQIGQWQLSIGNDARTPDTNPGQHRVPGFGSELILLVDSNSKSRESREKAFRTMGVAVHAVASAATARTRLADSKYNLVLVDLGRDTEAAESLVAEIRAKDRRQRVAFLVGRPLLLASSLKTAPQKSSAPAQAPVIDGGTPAESDFGRKIREAEAQAASSL